MSREWHRKPPFENWRSYGQHLAAYAAEWLSRPEHLLPDLVSCGDFARLHAAVLRNNPTDRVVNGRIASVLLPFFESDPSSWAVLKYMNLGPPVTDKSLESYLSEWRSYSPPGLRPTVDELSRMFGVT
jgi:hypothetical protein